MAFMAYDCNCGSAPIKQYLLLDPEPCGDMPCLQDLGQAQEDQNQLKGASNWDGCQDRLHTNCTNEISGRIQQH